MDPSLIANGVIALLLVATTLGAKLTTDGRKQRRQRRRQREQIEILTEMVVDLRQRLIARGVKRSDLPRLPTDVDEDEDEEFDSPRPIGGGAR